MTVTATGLTRGRRADRSPMTSRESTGRPSSELSWRVLEKSCSNRLEVPARTPTGQERTATIHMASGNQRVTSDGQVGRGMPRTTTPRHPGTPVGHSRRSSAWRRKAHFPVRCSTQGTGENVLHIASLGLRVLGVDVAGTALSIAREKAAERGTHAEFVAADALRLDLLHRTFESVLDCGLFHTLDDDERRDYIPSPRRN
jgi:hypothetical protein